MALLIPQILNPGRGGRSDRLRGHQWENRLLDHLVARTIPGSVVMHYLLDDRVASDVARLIDERMPGTRPNVKVTKRLIVVTCNGAPCDEVLRACFPFSRTGRFV